MISDSALLGLPQSSKQFGWSINLALALNGIGYLYVTDADSDYNVQRESYLGKTLLSFSFYFHDLELSLTKQMKFSLSELSGKTLTYGAISLL